MITTFERFTDRARRVVMVAQEEARAMKHDYIGTEHVLLGLFCCEGVAGKTLENLGMTLPETREKALEITGEGKKAPSLHIPFTPRAKKLMELSLREALQLGHNYIGTEHLLLAMVRQEDGLACQILQQYAPLGEVRQQVIKILHGNMKKNEKTIENVLTVAPLSIPDRLDQLEVRLRIAEQMLGLR